MKRFLVTTLILGCSAEPGDLGEHALDMRVCASGETVDGIDVSAWQGTVNWSQVRAAGKRFAFMRVNHGLGDIDATFPTNWRGSHQAGLIRGAYQFFLASEDPIAQADLLVSKLAAEGGLQSGDLPPVLDAEIADGQPASVIVPKLSAWLNRVEQRTRRTPIIYTAQYFWSTLGDPPELGRYPVWVANYNVTCPLMPGSWSNWQFWQASSTGRVSGISGNVDLDRFNGSLQQLMDFANRPPLPDFGAAFHDQTYPMEMTSGDTAVAWIEYSNMGLRTWDLATTRLGTTHPRDRQSPFYDSANWISPSRLTGPDHSSYATGLVGRFSFTLHAPEVNQTTTFTEHFGLVQENVTWFGPADDEVWFQITVHPRGGGSAPPPDGGSPGGSPPPPAPGGNGNNAGNMGGGCSVGGSDTPAMWLLVLAVALWARRRLKI